MKQRESSAGFHFLSQYQNCRFKFYLRYVKGLIPRFTGPALSFGIAVHGALAEFLRTGGEGSARGAFDRLIRELREDYESEELWTFDANRGAILVSIWCAEVGRDLLRDFEVLAVEEELTPLLPNGYRCTLRPDAVLKQKRAQQEAFILETKTTRWGRDMVLQSLENSDQVSMYIWGAQKAHPEWEVKGVIPNILYQNKSKVVVGPLLDLVFRTSRELAEFEMQMMGVMTEISQKVQALGQGYPPIALFDRNTSWCTSYNHPCEYMSICRSANLNGCPHGFVQSEWIDKKWMEEHYVGESAQADVDRSPRRDTHVRGDRDPLPGQPAFPLDRDGPSEVGDDNKLPGDARVDVRDGGDPIAHPVEI